MQKLVIGKKNQDASNAELMATIQKLQAELDAAKKSKSQDPKTKPLRITDKGCVSVPLNRQYGGVYLYAKEWDIVLSRADEIRAFIKENQKEIDSRSGA